MFLVCARILATSLLFSSVAFDGCRSSTPANGGLQASISAADPADPSSGGPGDTIQIHPVTRSRMPRACPFVSSPPSDAQAAVLLQCTMEISLRDSTDVLQNVSVHVGSSRPLDEEVSRVVEGIDTRQPLYNMTASGTWVACIDSSIAPGTNCTEHYYVNAPGYCYKLVGKGWRCSIPGTFNSDAYKGGLPPPTTF